MSQLSSAERARPPFLRLLSRWWRGRLTAASLSTLDDALLKDIGLSRGDIDSVARHGHDDVTRHAR